MNKAIVIKNQSLLDHAIINHGTLEAIIHITMNNNLSITDELFPGQELDIVPFENENPIISEYIRKSKIQPATAISEADEDLINPDDPCDLCKCFT